MKHWTRDTSDSVVEHGTSLYDKIGKYEFLAIEDLPSVVEILLMWNPISILMVY